MHSPQLDDDNNRYVKTILILAANPNSTSRLQLDKEIREIDEGLRRGNKREQFKLEQKWAVSQRDFYRAILDYQPQIVHFSGHGAGVDGIVLENEVDEPAFLNADALSSMFESFATMGVECVLLNACYSEVQAKAISQHVNYVIGMNQAVGDKAAIAFSVAFYDAIAAGEQTESAYKLGCAVLISYSEQQTPVLFKKDPLSIKEPSVEIIPPNPLNAEILFQSLTTKNLFASGFELNALLSGLKTGIDLKKYSDIVDTDNRTMAIVALQQVVYGVKEHNRLEGHSSEVWSVVFSPDGKMIASGSDNNTVKLWNLSGQKLHNLKGHSGSVNSVVFSPDGQTIATGSNDNTVKLWNLSAQELHTLKGHSGQGVQIVVFSPDGKMIASGGTDKTVKLWNLSGQLLHNLKWYSNWVKSVVFSPDGQTIATGYGDNTVQLWNLSGQLLHTLKGHDGYVNSVVFSPDGQMIASGSDDNTVKLWNLSGQELHTLKGHSDSVNSVVFRSDGQMIASGSSDYTVKLWNLSGQLLDTLEGHSDRVKSVMFSPDGQMIASSSYEVKLWNLNLDDLLKRGCDWIYDYLENNPNVNKDDHHLCDDVAKRK